MGWALIAVIVALGAATLWVVARFDAQRTAAWRRVADELGYEFVDRVPTAELPGADILKAFDRGRWMGARNVLKGVEGPARVTLCDYRYSIGSARNTNSDHVTLCLVETPEIDVPTCYARPQMVPFFDAIGKLVGRQNIEFEDGHAFSGAYVLEGTDEDAVRELFSAAVRRFFVKHKSKRWVFEGAGRALCLSYAGRTEPHQATSLVADALEILEALRTRG